MSCHVEEVFFWWYIQVAHLLGPQQSLLHLLPKKNQQNNSRKKTIQLSLHLYQETKLALGTGAAPIEHLDV